jgi:drug/metabolite transporter (DMT)-like permease
MYRTTIINIFATICFIPFSIYDFYNYDFTKINYISFLSVLYYGTFISVISFILWFRAIEKVSASSAAVFSGVMPISSMLLSSLILKEKISYFHIISLILIIMGICASCLKFKKTAFNKQFNYKL